MTVEKVVLVDDAGKPIGTADKAAVHTDNTPLHLAFSAYVVRPDGRTLLTRRALSKKTWPGTWTNSFCGHPAPGETTEAAVVRRAGYELGIDAESVDSIEEVLPDFRYRAVDSSGIVEHEICPVYLVRIAEDAQVNPRRDEVEEYAWVDASALVDTARQLPQVLSPWCVSELAEEALVKALSEQTSS
ncbi:isopentenyl-diphosphate Delta-isomerase [Corynebacterium tapiri]|uniref:Isopentenyl-diphosphate Delta-isomerase n=1 Tax=Corynebacterium tapiri TaxID=1448266 RepID=A0A5C4U3Z4_9CORY|nr:isopentenyl-diphosphate Delta-isomerase [Corynebacterium tapiri]TNL96603.1 isopentenyl-diphosphate Delta-isomerase [Corynebacterium tapiri]